MVSFPSSLSIISRHSSVFRPSHGAALSSTHRITHHSYHPAPGSDPRSRAKLTSMSFFTSSLLFTLVLVIGGTSLVGASSFDEFLIEPDVVKNMVRTFGRELSSAGTEQTCLGRIEENFQAFSQEVSFFDGNKMMDDMRHDVINMLTWKRHAVERIANESERLAANHTYDKDMNNVPYINVKNVDLDISTSSNRKLDRNFNFDNNDVDLEQSAIHVPVNVYEKSPDIINDIKWSESLTPSFKNNLAFDPSLSWQFFGSAKGFLRLYPTTAWKDPPNFSDKQQPDFYDCRMRRWYIQGAASPKDVVILLDTSGSMTGVRKKIAASVVSNILDTLTDDDYVAALQFSKEVKPINPCFDSLVQASKRNVLEIKASLDSVKTSEMVNFTAALVEAFNMLQSYNRSGLGSQCNQAIMIVTDGAPDTYEEIFKQYNWPNIPVRVFTYLIGKDTTAHSEVYWMACHNRGYYTHVANLAEVHEEVQKYIPVLSRPIVLSGKRVFSWTGVYAPNSEIELTPWNWDSKQSYEIINKLRQTSGAQGLTQDESSASEQQDNRDRRETAGWTRSAITTDERSENKPPPSIEQDAIAAPYISNNFANLPSASSKQKKQVTLYTTLSTPVFDTRNYTNITKRILIKNVYQDSEPEQIRIANLLGVAGIDVPIKEIIKLTPAFKLGVNAYVFIISNNGYILYHPDLRPFFQEFLKPFYNSVDMSEVELANNTNGAREWDPEIESIRNNMIKGTHGWRSVAVKMHLDEMKRVVTRVNHYSHGLINNTPFSLAIALPEPYGSYRLVSQIDLRMRHKLENFTNYFRGNQWRVHPDWAYCSNPHRSTGATGAAQPTPEEAIVQFLSNDLEKQNFRWRTSSIRPQVYDTISCDKDLIQSLVLDAKLTDIPSNKCNTNPNYRDEQRIKTFGIASTFVATRSGLTRFQDYRSSDEIRNPFYEEHTRAIEETFYKRAVDFYGQNKDAFVYSVDYDAGAEHAGRPPSATNFLVTATHALFIGNGKQSTPVAVVGIQFRYMVLHEFFLNTTGKFNVPCTHMDVDCYLVDNNGFVVLSNHRVADVGRFFGLVDGDILNELVAAGVYRKIHMFDYQAICLEPEGEATAPSSRPFVFSVIGSVYSFLSHIITTLVGLYLNVIYGQWNILAANLESISEPSYGAVRQDWGPSEPTAAAASPAVTSDTLFHTNRTRAIPCDKEFDLFEMMDFSNFTRTQELACGQNTGCTRKYVAQYVPHTNLIMVLVSNNPSCTCTKSTVDIEPRKVTYTAERQCQLRRTEKYRKRPATCHNYHAQEKDIRQCGGSHSLRPSALTVLAVVLSTLLYRLAAVHPLHSVAF